MSRHRAVKNIDLADELDDDYGDEDYYADMTSEQQAQMAQAFSAVQAVLGTESPISDKAIRDALWDSYFDVDGTIAHLLDEQHKKEVRRKKEEDTAPSDTLASLSLDSPASPVNPSDPSPSPAPAATAPPKNKLAAKMAANRAAKAAAAAAAAPSAPPPSASPAPAPSAATSVAAAPEKKLSKLQQKMLSARAGRAAAPPAEGLAPPVASASPPAAAAAADKAAAAGPPTAPTSAAPSFEPMALDTPLTASLTAAPSPFASALSSRAALLFPTAHRIATSISVRGGVEPAQLVGFGPSPDDRVMEARKGTALGAKAAGPSSRPATPSGGPAPALGKKKAAPGGKPAVAGPVSALQTDLEAMGLGGAGEQPRQVQPVEEPAPVMRERKKILEEVRAKEEQVKPVLSLVVVGHVDAGKSTLMGRLLHELGQTTDKEINNYQRQSEKIGKGSFAYAWTFDAMEEERERGVTIDVAIDSFETARKRFTLIDAPGHRDFIPNMISGAAQADAAVLVVDGSKGGFEKGFEGGGQTREHAVLVRSLGVQQLVVAVNKLDAVDWSQARFEAICQQLQPFLVQTGFQTNKVAFVPVGAMSGVNLVDQMDPRLEDWYDGQSLVTELDCLDVPTRALDAPLRIPIANVFKGQSATASGLAVVGRVESGIVQVGETLAALPGDESGTVRALEVDGELVPYAVAGDNATVFLSGIEANQLGVGSVLCPPSQPVPVVSSFTAQIIVFEPKHPITAGYAVELFHHSRDIPATIAALEATIDNKTGQVTKNNPRMLTKNTSARVRIQLRSASTGGRSGAIPIEPFAVNKSMGRVLFRRNGETVAAGVVLETLQ
ncbi:hypothetical protein Rhopal_003764-T1 [Rhodotorula paludigena]|uniref:Elongation factor 1 alpha-like protein n=1 Tax=Rhodotorula paludigena TaxID=86838 RepID=A0AAV5GMK9_9BASI|nr:hypothetical protein Rhopal_003764-T1 [Rhodotorula paludigena]